MDRLLKIVILNVFLVSFCRPFCLADESLGSVQVVVQNEEGQLIPNAPVYLSDSSGNRFLVTNETGAVDIDLPPGVHDFSCAMTVKNGDSVDRYASPPAHVQVFVGDLTSIVLRLVALPDPTTSMELSTLRKIGVDPDLAKDLN